jgi:opacity protein-like surface antigen
VIVSYDYMHSMTDDISLFGGATLGWVKNKATLSGSVSVDDEVISDSESISDRTFQTGLQVGAQYKVNENWTTDLTYRRMFNSMDKKVVWDEDDYERYEVKGHSSLTLSVDYRF